jgi:L-alanine-DL-glutamate epimerase-like enolase superfamily enzyme
MLLFQIEERIFQFNFSAGTSRGILTQKKSWFISISMKGLRFSGLGECSVIEGLTPEFISETNYYSLILQAIKYIETFELEELIYQFNTRFNNSEIEVFFSANSSIRFGFETALLDLKNQKNGVYFENSFSKGQKKLPINGLIWMGNEAFMKKQIEEKLAQGFTTLKMKVGSIDYYTELKLLKSIRSSFSEKEIALRVDANGAFSPENVEDKLQQLAQLAIHSIEQPLKPGLIEQTKKLCAKNIVPIALDEELIGSNNFELKRKLLEEIQPQFIILKPSLHGGIKGVREWISIANLRGIQWWMTSALESNVGLSAICQLTAEYTNNLPQGLGTGSLYINNIEKGLKVQKGYIFFAYSQMYH